ncbi:S-adenosyl-L-methionine-dependent methyltransferase [Lactarius vividus]|nr:S-adenosyl-L-methionine-dependent methyltransferase [Lactarius vividus]
MLVAHEFFDALPFHLIEQRKPTPVSTLLGASSPRFATLPIGARIEVSAASFQTARKLGTLVSQGAGGSALVVDYGTDHAVGNSFRAFKGHALADPFEHPGQADLTANVDFAYLAEALKGTGPLSQRAFLLHMGIGTRVSALQRAAASPARADALTEAAARLVDPAGMGREYKVMGVTGGAAAATADVDGVWPFVAGEIREEAAAAAGGHARAELGAGCSGHSVAAQYSLQLVAYNHTRHSARSGCPRSCGPVLGNGSDDSCEICLIDT